MKSERMMIRLTPEVMKKLKKEAVKQNRRPGEMARVIIESFLQKK